MPRKTQSAQPSLFRREVPAMPEGYYSPGPNPNLPRFVAEHATPYDPATDAYAVPPFDKPITTTKATAIYNMHTYWSKKPHDAIRQYIAHYTQPGDPSTGSGQSLVLDPFCGSGGTALAALLEGRAAIAIDLSPAATFITKNYCTPVDVSALQAAFAELEARVKPELDWLYETRCDRCDGRATTGYTVYSYVFQCPRCLEKTPLFDCVAAETDGGKPVQACPHCYARGVVEEISTRTSERFDPVPVLVSYLCEEGCKPQRGERRHNDPNPKKRDFFARYDLAKLREIEGKPIPHWVPPHRMMNVASDTEPWGDEWRLGRNFRTVAELFTKRNLWALAAILAGIHSQDDEVLLFAFHANILSATIMQQYREAGGGFAKGTYYVPSIFIERGQWACFERKFKDVVKGKQEINNVVRSTSVLISTDSAVNVTGISSNSVDYIFTDPPYADKIQYGELNFIWEAWLNFDTHWHDLEIIVNRTREKSEADWARLMRQAMAECYRVLKPGRWISLCYHDTSEGTWQLLQDLMAEVGFISEQTENALYIDAGQKSYNQLVADKVTKRDLVINFRKPRPGELPGQLALDCGADTFEAQARALLRDALDAQPGSPADRLYDALVSRMVRRGAFERHNFDALLRSVAEETPPGSGRWYLLETAEQAGGVGDDAERVKEEAAAAHLEAWMRARINAEAQRRGGAEREGMHEGVHYSDLFEQYLAFKDKPRRLLAEWLPEYFFKTEDASGANLWRLPADDSERAQLAALRADGALRRIKRFARALLAGVPPHPRDLPPNIVTAADWLRQCRRAGLYEYGRALYEKGGFDFASLGEERELEVEEEYQVCVRRVEKG